MTMNKNQILANILMAPEADIPAIVAAAINQWTSLGLSVTELFRQTISELGKMDDDDLADEVILALEDYEHDGP